MRYIYPWGIVVCLSVSICLSLALSQHISLSLGPVRHIPLSRSQLAFSWQSSSPPVNTTLGLWEWEWEWEWGWDRGLRAETEARDRGWGWDWDWLRWAEAERRGGEWATITSLSYQGLGMKKVVAKAQLNSTQPNSVLVPRNWRPVLLWDSRTLTDTRHNEMRHLGHVGVRGSARCWG